MTSQPTTAGDRLSYLRARLAELYPPPFEVRLPGDPVGAGEPATAYAALPSARRVRVLVPMRPPRASARSLRRQLGGSRLRTRAMRIAMSAAARSGLLVSVPGVPVTITGSGESVETLLREQLGVAELLITMPVGPQRATRKSVLQVTDHDGSPIAYVKVGHDQLTRRLVRHEGKVLATVDRASWSTIEAPELLGRVEWRGLSLLLMSPLTMPTRLREGPTARAALLSTVEQIAGGGKQGVALEQDGGRAFRQRLASQLRPLDAVGAPALRDELATLESEATPLVLGCWHGDLNPGNLVLGPGRVTVWDWERFETGVPLGLDLLHHDLMNAITVRGQAPLAAAEDLLRSSPSTLDPLGLDGAASLASARLYLLLLAARYLGDRQVEAGAVLGQVENWLVPALQRSRKEDHR